MPVPGGLPDWPVAYAQCLLRAAQQSARSLDLHYLILRRVASGELSAAAVSAALARTLERRGREQADRAAALGKRFLEGLSQCAQHAAETYAAQLGELARGAAHSDVRAEAGGQDQANRAVATANDAALLWVDLLGGLTDLSAEWEEEWLCAVLAGDDADAAPALQLEAAVGEETSTVLSLENTRSEPAVVRCRAADVRRLDGVGPAFVPELTFEPADVTIDPHAAREVRVSLTLDRELYQPHSPYVGHIHLVREGERVDVPLRIVAR